MFTYMCVRVLACSGSAAGPLTGDAAPSTLALAAPRGRHLEQARQGVGDHLQDLGTAQLEGLPPARRTRSVPAVKRVDWLFGCVFFI